MYSTVKFSLQNRWFSGAQCSYNENVNLEGEREVRNEKSPSRFARFSLSAL